MISEQFLPDRLADVVYANLAVACLDLRPTWKTVSLRFQAQPAATGHFDVRFSLCHGDSPTAQAMC